MVRKTKREIRYFEYLGGRKISMIKGGV